MASNKMCMSMLKMTLNHMPEGLGLSPRVLETESSDCLKNTPSHIKAESTRAPKRAELKTSC